MMPPKIYMGSGTMCNYTIILRPFGSKRLLRRRARKQRFTFASSKRKTQTATEAEAQQSGIGDFPHSTLGKALLQIGIIFLKPHGIALSLHREQETTV